MVSPLQGKAWGDRLYPGTFMASWDPREAAKIMPSHQPTRQPDRGSIYKEHGFPRTPALPRTPGSILIGGGGSRIAAGLSASRIFRGTGVRCALGLFAPLHRQTQTSILRHSLDLTLHVRSSRRRSGRSRSRCTSPEAQAGNVGMWLRVKTNGIPFWGRRCTTRFRTYFSRDWDYWDVRDFDPCLSW